MSEQGYKAFWNQREWSLEPSFLIIPPTRALSDPLFSSCPLAVGKENSIFSTTSPSSRPVEGRWENITSAVTELQLWVKQLIAPTGEPSYARACSALLHITTPCPALFLGCAVAVHMQPPATCPCISSHFFIPPFQAAHSVCGQ